MSLDNHIQAYATARQLREDIRAIASVKKTEHYHPGNQDLIRREARILQAKTHYKNLQTAQGLQSIDDLITQRPQHIHRVFRKEFDSDHKTYRGCIEDYDLAHKQTAQRLMKFLGTKDEDPTTDTQREILKALYNTIIEQPISIGYDSENEVQVTAADKAWYFGTNQDRKEEPTSREEALANIAALKAMLEQD